jgi:hypothetical protein
MVFLLTQFYYVVELSSEREALSLAAMNKVLHSLGDESYSLIERYLRHVKCISLEPNSQKTCSFEELNNALQLLLGERTATILIEKIFVDADLLAETAKSY